MRAALGCSWPQQCTSRPTGCMQELQCAAALPNSFTAQSTHAFGVPCQEWPGQNWPHEPPTGSRPWAEHAFGFKGTQGVPPGGDQCCAVAQPCTPSYPACTQQQMMQGLQCVASPTDALEAFLPLLSLHSTLCHGDKGMEVRHPVIGGHSPSARDGGTTTVVVRPLRCCLTP